MFFLKIDRNRSHNQFNVSINEFAELNGTGVKIQNYDAAARNSNFFVSFQFIGFWVVTTNQSSFYNTWGVFFCNTINVIFYSLTFSVIRLTINSPRKVVVWILKSNMRSIITISFLRRLLHRIWFGMQIVTYTVANPYIL